MPVPESSWLTDAGRAVGREDEAVVLLHQFAKLHIGWRGHLRLADRDSPRQRDERRDNDGPGSVAHHFAKRGTSIGSTCHIPESRGPSGKDSKLIRSECR